MSVVVPAAPLARVERELGDAYPSEVRAWVLSALDADEFEELPQGLKRHLIERLGRSQAVHGCPECRNLSLWRFVEGLANCRACGASMARVTASRAFRRSDAPPPAARQLNGASPQSNSPSATGEASTANAAVVAPAPRAIDRWRGFVPPRPQFLDSTVPPLQVSSATLSLGRAIPPPPPPLEATMRVVRPVRRRATAAVEKATVERLRRAIEELEATPIAADERKRLSKDPGAEHMNGMLREACLPEVKEGSQHLKRGRYEEALAAFSAAILKNPHHPQPWTKRGMVRAYTGDLAGAVQDYSEALIVDRIYLPAWANRASAEFHRGNLDATVHDATRALELAPKLAQAWLFRGIAFAKLGAATEAEDDLVHFLSLSPYSPYVRLIRNTLREVEARVAG